VLMSLSRWAAPVAARTAAPERTMQRAIRAVRQGLFSMVTTRRPPAGPSPNHSFTYEDHDPAGDPDMLNRPATLLDIRPVARNTRVIIVPLYAPGGTLSF
jgi:hypothetical protein